MKDAPAFDFYPERWLAGVAEMSNADQLVYLRLLCHSWLRDGLPDDTIVLARLVGRKVSAPVLAKFPLGEDGIRRNPRLETIRNEQRERIASRRNGAMKTNAKRWPKPVVAESLVNRSASVERVASKSLSDRSATIERTVHESPPPTTHPKVRESTARDLIGVQSEMIALAYPRQDDPICVRSVIADDLNAGQDVEQMHIAVAKCADYIRKAPGGSSNRYVPSARNFFEGRQWRSPEALQNRWTPNLALKGDQPPKKPVKLTTPAKGGF